MTLEEIKALLDVLEVPVYYNHAPLGVSVPFIIYRESTKNFSADDKVYKKILQLEVEFYSNTKDISFEETIETLLEDTNIVWNKETIFNSDNEIYQTNYNMEV